VFICIADDPVNLQLTDIVRLYKWDPTNLSFQPYLLHVFLTFDMGKASKSTEFCISFFDSNNYSKVEVQFSPDIKP
jgi:hypothetical protein